MMRSNISNTILKRVAKRFTELKACNNFTPKPYLSNNGDKPNKYVEFFRIMSAEIQLIAALFPTDKDKRSNK
jgi:hypothetical protein